MKHQAHNLPVFGLELTAQQLGTGLLTLGGVVAFCLLFGFHVIGIALLVAAALGGLMGAVQWNSLADPPSVRFAQIRRISDAILAHLVPAEQNVSTFK